MGKESIFERTGVNMGKTVITRMENLKGTARGGGNGFGYTKYFAGSGEHSKVNFYELPPLHSNYPYHWHCDCDEVFYIISGEGILKTPEGERQIRAGDLIICPCGEEGAHRLTNTSGTEVLRYIDFDTVCKRDVCIYPDSQKVGIWGETLNKVYRIGDGVDYYEGEVSGEYSPS